LKTARIKSVNSASKAKHHTSSLSTNKEATEKRPNEDSNRCLESWYISVHGVAWTTV